jgi:hypothetical protein
MHGINQGDVGSPKARRKVVIFVDFVGVKGKGGGGEPNELCNHLYFNPFIYNHKIVTLLFVSIKLRGFNCH